MVLIDLMLPLILSLGMTRTFTHPVHSGIEMTRVDVVSVAQWLRRLLRRFEEVLDGVGERKPRLSSQFFPPRLIMLVGLVVTIITSHAMTHDLPHIVYSAGIGGAAEAMRSLKHLHESHPHFLITFPTSYLFHAPPSRYS